jgi:hypothetical protein
MRLAIRSRWKFPDPRQTFMPLGKVAFSYPPAAEGNWVDDRRWLICRRLREQPSSVMLLADVGGWELTENQ